MTVVQLGPVPPPHGGVQTNLMAIRQHLRRYGVRAPVINLTRHRREPADDVFYPRNAVEVVRLLMSTPADLLHLHIGGRLPARLLALCLVCTLIPKRRVVLTFHSGGYPSEGGTRHAHPWSIRGLLLQRLDAIIAVNEELAAVFRALGVVPSRIRVIVPYAPIAVPADVVLPEAISRFKASHQPLLTVVGGLEREYDLPTPIEAIDAIRQQFPDAGLLLIGSGSIESEICELVSRSRNSAHILMCGDVPHAQTLATMAASDVFLRTTLYDGDSISVREALHAGTPVIATDNGMRPPGVHLVPISNPSALAAAVVRVLGQPSARQPDQPATDTPLEQVLDLYSEILGRNVRVNATGPGSGALCAGSEPTTG